MSMSETSPPIEHLDRGPRSKDELAAAVAAAIPPGSYVNTPRMACSTWGPPLGLIRSTRT